MTSAEQTFFLLSLPYDAAPGGGGEAQDVLDKWIETNLDVSAAKGELAHLDIPSFKIGTLDNLVQQSEELHKLDGQVNAAVAKVADVINNVYDGNKAQVAAAKRIDDDRTVEKYILHFAWNKNKYRVDKPISETVDVLAKEIFALETDVRQAYNEYSTAKTNRTAADRKQTGNLSVRSLHNVVRKEHFVHDSEYLTTVLVAVPKSLIKEFESEYETLTEMVVPRSATVIASDDEYVLFNVTLFTKYKQEFVNKCREKKWTPRDFVYSEESVADLKKEQQVATQQERKLWGEVVRLSRTGYSDIVKCQMHLKVIRVFVESILRYGLPPNFLTNIIKPNQRALEKAEQILINQFGYLGGNAFSKDKKGNLSGDADLSEYGAVADTDYKPFVLYPAEVF